MTRVAVIGIGVMGSAIAARLLDTGAQVYVHDRTSEKCADLARRGARLAATARAACTDAEFVICSLNSAAIVEQVVFGIEGVGAAAMLRSCWWICRALTRPAPGSWLNV